MNKRKYRVFLFCTAAAILILLMSAMKLDARAGFGDFNDYGSDSGGYSDYSDYGSSDYGSSYDDWDTEWDSSYNSDGYTVSFRHRGIAPVVIVVTIIWVLILGRIATRGMRSITKGNQPPAAGGGRRILPDRTDEISRIIQEKDAFFTAPDFLSFAKQVYMDIQSAWEKRDLDPVRGVLHQNLYQQTNRQIEKKIEDGIVNHLERISINTAYLTSYRRDRQYEYLTIYLAASMIDYQVKEATGEVILGDKTTRWNLKYKMTFMRSADAKTRSAKEADRGFVCPNCGAPLRGTSFDECEYCGSIVTTGTYDWVLSSFGVVKDDTVDEGIRIN